MVNGKNNRSKIEPTKNRRNALKAIGGIGLGGVVSPARVAATNDKENDATDDGTQASDPPELVEEPQKNWEEKEEVTNSTNVQMTSALCWYSSWYSPSLGWQHDIGLFSSVCVEDGLINRPKIIGAQELDVSTSLSDYRMVDPLKDEGYCGVYPNSNGLELPEWVSPAASLALGLYNPIYSFPIAASQIYKSMAPEDGYSENGDSFSFRHTPSFWSTNGWGACSNYQRFVYTSESDGTSSRITDLTVKPSSEAYRSPYWTMEHEYELHIWKDDEPYETTSISTIDPREMTSKQQEEYGIKKVESEEKMSLLVDNREEDEPVYRANNLPMAVESETNSSYGKLTNK